MTLTEKIIAILFVGLSISADSHATDYSIPGAVPSTCVVLATDASVYNCTTLTLAMFDTLILKDRVITLNVTGAVAVGNYAQINMCGKQTELTINTPLGVVLNRNSQTRANINSGAGFSLGSNAYVNGDVSVSTGAIALSTNAMIFGAFTTIGSTLTPTISIAGGVRISKYYSMRPATVVGNFTVGSSASLNLSCHTTQTQVGSGSLSRIDN